MAGGTRQGNPIGGQRGLAMVGTTVPRCLHGQPVVSPIPSSQLICFTAFCVINVLDNLQILMSMLKALFYYFVRILSIILSLSTIFLMSIIHHERLEEERSKDRASLKGLGSGLKYHHPGCLNNFIFLVLSFNFSFQFRLRI